MHSLERSKKKKKVTKITYPHTANLPEDAASLVEAALNNKAVRFDLDSTSTSETVKVHDDDLVKNPRTKNLEVHDATQSLLNGTFLFLLFITKVMFENPQGNLHHLYAMCPTIILLIVPMNWVYWGLNAQQQAEEDARSLAKINSLLEYLADQDGTSLEELDEQKKTIQAAHQRTRIEKASLIGLADLQRVAAVFMVLANAFLAVDVSSFEQTAPEALFITTLALPLILILCSRLMLNDIRQKHTRRVTTAFVGATAERAKVKNLEESEENKEADDVIYNDEEHTQKKRQ
jgi:hypothetical protein